MPEPLRIDCDEYERINAELAYRAETRLGNVTAVAGNHKIHGRVTLTREAGQFHVQADKTSFIRPFGVSSEEA